MNDSPALCDRCEDLFDSLHRVCEERWRADSRQPWIWKPFDYRYRSFDNETSLPARCDFCAVLDYGDIPGAPLLSDHPDFNDQDYEVPPCPGSYAVLTRNYLLIVDSIPLSRETSFFVRHEFQLAALPEESSTETPLAIGRPVERDPSATTAVKLVTEWLRTCIECHHNCRGRKRAFHLAGILENKHSHHFVPTRLVDVGTADSGDDTRLIISSEFDWTSAAGRVEWVALSHRWGDGACAGVTTTANLDARRKRLEVATLPQTFQDAIKMTRSLRIRYLWIDSLCILQDEPDDWSREYPAMGGIYQNATLTIAAHNAWNSTDSFLQPRQHRTTQLLIASRSSSSSTSVKQNLYIRAPLRPWNFQVEGKGSSLSNRGWVLQEAVLSPRTLHVCEDNMFWQCSSVVLSEGFHPPLYCAFDPSPLPEKLSLELEGTLLFSRALFPVGTERKPSLFTLCLVWRSLMAHYSTRELSVADDKLAAVAGLASHFQAEIPLGYAAGIFEYDVHVSLLWRTTSADHTKVSRTRPPSWSWASSDAHLEFTPLPPIPPAERPEWDAAIRLPASDAAGSPITPQLQEPFEVTSRWLDADVLKLGHLQGSTLVLNISSNRFATCDFDIKTSQELRSRENKRDFGFLLICETGRDSAYYEAYCLLLEAVEGNPSVFRRIGLGKIDSGPRQLEAWAPPVEDWERRTVKIV